jgi:ubiquitin C-terminal hydrolase
MGTAKSTKPLSKYESNLPESEKLLGFHNDSNICYANSAIQVLFGLKSFRKIILDFKPYQKEKDYFILHF